MSEYDKDKITLKKFVSRDPNTGSVTFSDVPIKGKFNIESVYVKSESGEQVISRANVFFYAAITVSHNDKIVFNSMKYNIISIVSPGGFGSNSLTAYLE